jgi:hypothetical protein
VSITWVALRTLGSKAAGALSGAGSKGAGGRLASAGRTCNCFPGGTKVATATGATAIQQIRVGDRVWARDLTTGTSQLRRVSGLFHKQATRLLTITVAGTSIQVTPEHPFWSPGRGWVEAGQLRKGDRLLARDGRSLTITRISSRAVKATVYNFEVEGDHNYYITGAQLLVHNCPTGGGSGGGGASAGAGEGAETAAAVGRGARSSLQPVRAGEAGSYRSLSSRGVVGDQLTAHHMPQAALGFTSREEGGALVLQHSEHVLTRTYGVRGAQALAEDQGLSFRQVLAKDIWDIRSITGSRYNQGVLDLLDYYRTNFPELMAKGGQ